DSAEVARSGELVVQAAVGDQEDLPVAFLAVDDPRQVHARFTDEIAAELDRELRPREFIGKAFEPFGQRRTDGRGVERLVAVEIGNAETAPHVEVRQGAADLSAEPCGEVEHVALRLNDRRGVERLAAGEDVQAAPVGTRTYHFTRKRRDARLVDPGRLGTSAHLYARYQ